MQRNERLCLTAAAALVSLPLLGVARYGDLAAWEAAAGGSGSSIEREDFESGATRSGGSLHLPSGLIVMSEDVGSDPPSVQESSWAEDWAGPDPRFRDTHVLALATEHWDPADPDQLATATHPRHNTLVFDEPVSAFSMEAGFVEDEAFSIYWDGDQYTGGESASVRENSFVGLVFENPVTRIDFDPQWQWANVDEFRWVAAGPSAAGPSTPEPSAFLLFTGALLLLRATVGRR